MRTATKKHLSVHNRIARFVQVSVAQFDSEEERIREPGLFFGDRRVEHPTESEQAVLAAAVTAVREEEGRRGVLLCVVRVVTVEVDAHPEAARQAALAAVSELLEAK